MMNVQDPQYDSDTSCTGMTALELSSESDADRNAMGRGNSGYGDYDLDTDEEEALDVNTSAGTVNIIAEEVEARETVARMEKQLRDAQRRLEGVHKKKYNKSRGTDSETDQSG